MKIVKTFPDTEAPHSLQYALMSCRVYGPHWLCLVDAESVRRFETAKVLDEPQPEITPVVFVRHPTGKPMQVRRFMEGENGQLNHSRFAGKPWEGGIDTTGFEFGDPQSPDEAGVLIAPIPEEYINVHGAEGLAPFIANL